MVVRLALLAALFMVSSISGAPNAKDGSFKLTILHNNDMHARFEQTGIYSDKCSKADADANLCFGGFARVAHEVRRYRALAKNGQIPQVLYLNAGDTYTGTPWFSIFKDEIASAFLKMLEPDAIVSNFILVPCKREIYYIFFFSSHSETTNSTKGLITSQSS